MARLQKTSLEWALLHLLRFSDSDFFPRLFEFEAIKHNWETVKAAILQIDLESYAPQTPEVMLAPKPGGTYRVVHQLDPIDSLIYTALIYEHSELIENFRIPEERGIAWSYRVKLDSFGSFFDRAAQPYQEFLEHAAKLADKNPGGFVLVCDLVDFYNQIYLHRISNILAEAGATQGKLIEDFLSGLNTNVSRGIPVGPKASAILAEAVMADIDKKILTFTDSFTRYVDDTYIFFDTAEKAHLTLYHLTKYIYSNHRLVFSSGKTKVVSVEQFKEQYLIDQDKVERQTLHQKIAELRTGEYSTEEEVQEFDDLESPEQFRIRAEAYRERFEEALTFQPLELGVTRHILRQAARYKVRSILPLIFDNFTYLMPALRDVVIYLTSVLTVKVVKRFENEFKAILNNPYVDLPYVNLWIFTLFQHDSFKETSILIDYSKILRIRERALIARRQHDVTLVKDLKDTIDTLGPWDRRAVLYASEILSLDEAQHWFGLVESKRNVLDNAVCSKVKSNLKSSDLAQTGNVLPIRG